MTTKPNIVLGEILFDIFPGERCMGGAPFNFAFHLHCLGMPVVFISRVGEDPLGREIFNFAQRYGFPVEGIQTDAEHPTGEVQVSLDSRGSPKFEILPDRAYDHIELNSSLTTPPLVYFGTLAQRSAVSRKTIRDILKKFSKDSMLFMDMNLRAPFYDRGIIESSLELCDVLKVSGEELEELRNVFQLPHKGDTKSVVGYFQETYNIKCVCVTRGEDGSELYKAEREGCVAQSAHPTKCVKDTVGAGDAFSAMLAFGLLRGLPESLILERASFFASEVCSIKGALPKSRDFYLPFGVEND